MLPCLPRLCPPPAEPTAELAAGGAVPLKQYQRALLRAKAFHGEARQLASQLRRMTAKAAKLKKAATALRCVRGWVGGWVGAWGSICGWVEWPAGMATTGTLGLQRTSVCVQACIPTVCLLLPCLPCSGALDEERAKRQELQEAMQQVVLNKAAAELEAAAAAAEQEEEEDEEAQVEMLDAEPAEEEEEEEKEQQAEEEQQAAPWVPRVVVLGRLHKGISTAERAGSVVVVRPSHLAAVSPPAPAAPAPEVVVLPASARKTRAPSALKQRGACTPAVARSAAKGATPAVAVAAQGKTPAAKGATPAVIGLGRTPAAAASAAKSAGAAPVLPQSMLKEAPGEGRAACGSRAFGYGMQAARPLSALWHDHLEVGQRCLPHPAAGTGGAATVVLENVELPGWLFEGEQAAPEVEAAAAVVAAEQHETAAPPAEAPAAAAAVQQQEEEEEQQQAVQPAAEEEREEAEMDVDGAAVAQASQQAQASAATQQQQEEAAASDAENGEEEEDFCHLCGQSGECAGGVGW